MRESYLRGKIRKFFEKIYLRLPFDKFHMISNYSFQIGRKMGLRKEKAVVIPWGIDWKEYKAVKKEPFVLFVGRIENQKGLIYLIEAAKRLTNIKFLIAGKGSQKEKLEKIAPKMLSFLDSFQKKRRRNYFRKH